MIRNYVTSSEESAEINNKCLVCDFEIPNSFTPCNCMICEDCLYEWIKTKNEETLHLENTFFLCPNKTCEKSIDEPWLVENLSKEKLEKINEILLSKYLISNKEVVKCPKSGCSFAGYMEKDACKDKYTCELCEFEWKSAEREEHELILDSKVMSEHLKKGINYLYSKTKTLFRWLPAELSELRVALLTKPCCHCARQIYKYQGCKHITCVCKREFCYVCLGDWSNHNSKACTKKEDSCAITISMMILIFIFKIIFSFNILFWILYYIIWAALYQGFGIALAGFLFFMSIVCGFYVSTFFSPQNTGSSYTGLAKVARLINEKSSKLFNFTKVLFILLLVSVYYLAWCSICNYEFVYFSIKIIIVEAMLTALYFICLGIFKFLKKMCEPRVKHDFIGENLANLLFWRK